MHVDSKLQANTYPIKISFLRQSCFGIVSHGSDVYLNSPSKHYHAWAFLCHRWNWIGRCASQGVFVVLRSFVTNARFIWLSSATLHASLGFPRSYWKIILKLYGKDDFWSWSASIRWEFLWLINCDSMQVPLLHSIVISADALALESTRTSP